MILFLKQTRRFLYQIIQMIIIAKYSQSLFFKEIVMNFGKLEMIKLIILIFLKLLRWIYFFNKHGKKIILYLYLMLISD